MERLAEDRKGPSGAEHKKRQMLGALAASLQVAPTARFLPHSFRTHHRDEHRKDISKGSPLCIMFPEGQAAPKVLAQGWPCAWGHRRWRRA